MGGESAPGTPMLTPPRGKGNGRIFQHNQIANCGGEEIQTRTDEGAEIIVNGGESAPGNPMLTPPPPPGVWGDGIECQELTGDRKNFNSLGQSSQILTVRGRLTTEF